MDSKDDEQIIRLNVPIRMSLHRLLRKLIPSGVKCEVVRALLQLLIDAQKKDNNQYIVQALLNGDCELRIKKN